MERTSIPWRPRFVIVNLRPARRLIDLSFGLLQRIFAQYHKRLIVFILWLPLFSLFPPAVVFLLHGSVAPGVRDALAMWDIFDVYDRKLVGTLPCNLVGLGVGASCGLRLVE
jgi:hypothetical protein